MNKFEIEGIEELSIEPQTDNVGGGIGTLIPLIGIVAGVCFATYTIGTHVGEIIAKYS